MPRLTEKEPAGLAREIKNRQSDLPVILLTHSNLVSQTVNLEESIVSSVDRAFVWSGNTDLLVDLLYRFAF